MRFSVSLIALTSILEICIPKKDIVLHICFNIFISVSALKRTFTPNVAIERLAFLHILKILAAITDTKTSHHYCYFHAHLSTLPHAKC
jgi:hypothetical protein